MQTGQSSSGQPGQPGLAVKVLRLDLPTLETSPDMLPLAALSFPRGIGPCYVGERFASLVTIVNSETAPTTSFSVQVEVMTPGQKRIVVAGAAPAQELGPGCMSSVRVAFEPQDAGTHSLQACVQYSVQGETRSFRKSFKFESMPVITFRTRVSALGASFAVETQVENTTESTLVLESASLSPLGNYKVSSLDDRAPLLRPKDVYQYTFLASGEGREIGTLAFGWRREPLGARGWVQSARVRA